MFTLFRTRTVAVLFILVAVIGGYAWGQNQPRELQSGAAFNETPGLWFVELDGPPTAEGASLLTVRQQKEAFRSAARAARISYTERYAFDTLWNGLSVRISRSNVAALSRIPGVRALYPVETYSIPPARGGISPELATALGMTGADVAQNELGLTGSGIRVAILDTGIDYDHPALGGDGVARSNSAMFPNSRVVAGYDFVGDAFDGGNDPVPDEWPDDCNGHGTHVAGITGANGAVKGVAPGVSFGAYRVFGCTGTTTDDLMIAAMERALADNMQVLNMSIGSAYQWPQYPTARASDRLVNKGVTVVASFGNNGTTGLYSGSAPGVGKKVIGVASFDNTHINRPSFTVTPDNTAVAYNPAGGAPPPPLSGSFPMSRTGTPTTSNDACSPLPSGSLAGTVVLIRRGTCGFYTKARNAELAGALGVVIYNNVAGLVNPNVAGSPPVTIPVVGISAADGVLINNRLASGPVEMTWTAQSVSSPNATGGLISIFSSYGLSPDLALKPDIGAPGGLIRSTIPLEQGGYGINSGTSMASPHVAGAAALLLEARPRTPSQAVRAILQNSAVPKAWWANPGLGFLDNVHRQGAGMLSIADAVQAAVKIEPAKLELGESEGGPATRTLVIENNGHEPVTLEISHVAALSTGPNTFTPSFFLSDASAAFSPSSVIVPAGGSASVDVTITPPSGPDRGQYGGYLVFSSATGIYRVPYAGFIGDYQSIHVLAPTPDNFPWLAKLAGASFINQPAGASYTLAGDDLPYFLVHLDHPVRRLRMEVFDARTGRARHRALELEYFRRNSAGSSFFAFAWDGLTFNGKKVNEVPNGDYVVRLSVQKALGVDENPAHWESWTSPVITLARP